MAAILNNTAALYTKVAGGPAAASILMLPRPEVLASVTETQMKDLRVAFDEQIAVLIAATGADNVNVDTPWSPTLVQMATTFWDKQMSISLIKAFVVPTID